MPKQLNVNLSMSADTSKLKSQLQDLQDTLKRITVESAQSNGNNFGLTKDIAQATSKVVELQTVLEECKTSAGNLDLGKFNNSLKKNNTTIQDYAISLSKLGPEGEQAFAKLARSITQAEIPLKRSSKLLSEFSTTLKNAARWQISSSILHGFMGSLQSAYGYAKSLNSSLNDIQIVTGNSTQQMAEFAEQANKAAQSLSTTTTAYSNAALIFYQQGLDDEAVLDRTNTVIKLANVTKDSAEDVSSYMTAIWENFYDGSKNLEYYADVITRLGADTAASSAEIAEGLESFASIGKTIGLSYEYATSALTTIVAKTRASASEVGNGLRTIFSRLQNLSLGETLDDGTDLTKYTKALATVGVSVKDASGELKSMDNILDDLASKWGTLDQAEKVALANTVGGVRQYTKLISLMDNWDFMKQNIQSAKNSEGSLQEQADIYAESWEAARDRVKAAAQEIYADLLDDKFFIAITDGFAKFLNMIHNTIQSLGGLPGVLSVISNLLLKIYGKDMVASMQRWKENFELRSDNGLEAILERRKEANEELRNMFINSSDDEILNQTKGSIYTEQANLQDLLITKQQQLVDQGTKLTDQEQRQANLLLDINEQMGQKAINAAKELQIQENLNHKLESQAKIQINNAGLKNSNNAYTSFNRDLKLVKELQIEYGSLQSIYSKISKSSDFSKTCDALKSMSEAAKNAGISFERIDDILEEVKTGSISDIEQLKNAIEAAELSVGSDSYLLFRQIESKAQDAGVNMQKFKPILDQMEQSFAQTGALTAEQIQTLKDYGINVEEVMNKLKGMKGTLPTVSQGIITLGQTLSSVAAGISSIKGLFDTWNNEDISFGEKLIATFTTLGTIIPIVTTAFNKQNLAQLASVSSAIASALGLKTEAIEAVAAGTATASFGTILYTVLWPLGLVTAALAGLVGIISLFIHLSNEPSEAEKNLEKTSKAAEKAKKAYEDAKTAAQELDSAFNQYDSVLQTFKDCTAGTQAWRDAMKELNDQVLALLRSYPELKQYLQAGENGELTFSQEGINFVKSSSQQRTNAALITDTAANIDKANAQVQTDKESVEKALDGYSADIQEGIIRALGHLSGLPTSKESDTETVLKSIEEYLRETAINQTKLQGIDENDPRFQETVNSYLAGSFMFDENGKKIDEEFEKLKEQTINAFDDPNLIAAIQNYAESVELVNTQASTSLTALTTSLLSDRDDLSSAEKYLAIQAVQNRKEEIQQQLKDEEYAQHSFKSKKDALAENTWRRYQEASGHTDWKLQEDAVQGTDSNRKYAYLDKDKKKQSISFDDMASAIAAFEALTDIGAAGKDAANALKKLDDQVGSTVASGIEDWMTSGNFESMSVNAFNHMMNDVHLDENGDYKKDEIENMLPKELIALLGDDWYEKFNSAAKDFSLAAKSITDNMSTSAKTIYDDTLKDKIKDRSISEQKSVANLIQNAFETSGRQGAMAIADQINEALKNGIDINDIFDFTDVVNNFDWSSGSLTDFSDALAAAGVDAKELGIDVEAIFKTMTQQSATALENIQKKYKNVHDIVSGLSTGDSISDEDYNTLTSEVGIENMKAYFSTMADGTHQLIGDAQAFYDIALAKSRGQMLNNISQANNLNTALTAGTVTVEDINKTPTENDNSNLTAARLTYLNSLKLEGEEYLQLKDIIDQYINEGKITEDNLTNLTELVNTHNISEEEYNNLLNLNNEILKQNSEALLSSASSLSELDSFASQVTEKTGGAVYGYSEALIHLAAQYDNCSKELQAYLRNANDATLQDLKTSIAAAEAAENIGLEVDEIEDLTKAFLEEAKNGDTTLENVKDNSIAAADAAVKYKRLNDAVLDISENYDDYTKVLKDVKESTDKVAKAEILSSTNGKKLKATLADLLDTSEDLIDADFLSAIDPKDFDAASKGDEEAIGRIRDAFVDAQAAAYDLTDEAKDFKEMMANLSDGETIDIDNSPFLQSLIQAKVAAGATETDIQNLLSGMNIQCDNVEFLNSMEDAITAAQNAGDAIIGNLGFNTETTQASDVNTGETQGLPGYSESYKSVDVPFNVTYMQSPFSTPQTRQLSYPAITKTVTIEPPESTPITTVTPVTGVKLSNAHKAAGGKVSTGTRQQAATNRGGSKGGGGGSSAKPQTKNSEKHITKEKEEDRYHVIKNQIEDLSAQYDRIGKAKDKAFGPNRIKLLDQEIAKQKELTAANKKYLEEVEQYQELDKSKMVSYGATFDKNGTITNYDKLLEEQVRLYNEAVDKFNEAYTDDEGAKAAFEAAKERYEQFKEDLDKYEESQDLYKDQLQAIIDAENQERALRLEKTQAEVELKVNVSEDSIEYLDYALNNIENKAYDVANAFALLDKKTATYFEKSKAYVDGLKSLFANQGLTDDDFNKLLAGDVSAFEKIKSMLSNGENAGFTSDDIDAIRDYVKELISTNEELQEVRQTVHDQLLTVWDEWNDKMDTAISKIEHLQNITSSYKNIIDIVGQKSLGLTDSFMSDLSQKTIDQANNKLQAEKARYDSLKKSRDEAFAKYENQKNSGILSEEEVKMWEDNLKQMDDDVQSAAESFQSAWEDALNAANEEFENSVQRIIDAYSDAAAGLMGSMSELQEAFDRGTDLSDQYLDDYEKIYQFSKLNRDIQESIDSTDSVKAKKELLALQSKINAYEESGVEISEYQMDYLRKEYELKKAQIDLEESKSAKSQVKMQRDNEGNYSYVYTANDDDVAKAEQNYEDKLHEMQVANADYIKELQGNMVQMEQDYQDKVQEIMTDTSLTAEERMVKLNEVNEYYDEKMKYYISEAQVWQDNSSRLYDQDWKNYSEMTGYKISAADQWIDKWKETQLAMLTGFSSLEEYQQNHDTNVANLLLSAGSAFSTWQTNIETAMNSAGTSIGTFGDDATETLKAISEASKETKDSVIDMAKSAEEAINGVTEAIINWEDAYSQVLKETLAGNEQLINSFNELLRAWSGVSSLPDTTPESKKVSTQSAPTPKTSSFDTGGYTGSWGADGKFALLHEKELILNAEDTKNFLTAIDTVRQISDMIDLNALSSSGGLTSLFAAKASTSDRTLQQEVTIHAEFPNVEDKDQISAAFNDLVNLASQYANRK